MTAAHSRFGASVRERNAGCPGSPRMVATVPPQRPGPPAIEGTKAHGVAEVYARKWLEDLRLAAPAGDAMAEGAALWRDTLFENLRTGCTALLEYRVALPEAHPDCFGTLDGLVYWPETHFLRVGDYKYGAGVEVSAVENKQLLQYATSALWRLGVPVREAELVIVQPRAPSGETVKRWRVGSERLFDETYVIRAEIEACLEPDAPLVPGSWCRWCPAAAVCPALREEAQLSAEAEFAVATTPTNYDAALLARCLDAKPRIEAWIKSLDAFAYAEAEAGRPAPGFKLVEKRLGNRKWSAKVGEICTRLVPLIPGANGHGEVLYTEPEMLSPAQVEKLLPKEHREAMDGLTVRESTGFVLVKESDPRPAATSAVRPEDEFPLVAENQEGYLI